MSASRTGASGSPTAWALAAASKTKAWPNHTYPLYTIVSLGPSVAKKPPATGLRNFDARWARPALTRLLAPGRPIAAAAEKPNTRRAVLLQGEIDKAFCAAGVAAVIVDGIGSSGVAGTGTEVRTPLRVDRRKHCALHTCRLGSSRR